MKIKLENRIIITRAKTLLEFMREQKHNYSGMPAKVRDAFMLRDWKRILSITGFAVNEDGLFEIKTTD